MIAEGNSCCSKVAGFVKVFGKFWSYSVSEITGKFWISQWIQLELRQTLYYRISHRIKSERNLPVSEISAYLNRQLPTASSNWYRRNVFDFTMILVRFHLILTTKPTSIQIEGMNRSDWSTNSVGYSHVLFPKKNQRVH